MESSNIKKKWKVTLNLMLDPSKGDETFPVSYTVEAENERDAYYEAEKMQDKDEPNICRRSVYNFKTKEL